MKKKIKASSGVTALDLFREVCSTQIQRIEQDIRSMNEWLIDGAIKELRLRFEKHEKEIMAEFVAKRKELRK